MSKPLPAHHREALVYRDVIEGPHGYAAIVRPHDLAGPWQIIAAAPITEKSAPAPAGMVRVIVAPAKVAP